MTPYLRLIFATHPGRFTDFILHVPVGKLTVPTLDLLRLQPHARPDETRSGDLHRRLVDELGEPRYLQHSIVDCMRGRYGAHAIADVLTTVYNRNMGGKPVETILVFLHARYIAEAGRALTSHDHAH